MRWLYVSAALVGALYLLAAPSVVATASIAAGVDAPLVPPETLAKPAADGHRGLIVIDPGHGGTNAGAPGTAPGVYEKQVTLKVARQLRSQLRQLGFAVKMTRDSDEYLTLRQRGRFANRVGADLFISIHANATPHHAQLGYETYVLSPRAVDIDARALRVEDGATRAGVSVDTSWLLDDIERGTAQDAAAEFAVKVQRELRRVRGRSGNRGVRQEAHHVLLGATMPAVLVEIGFIDHPTEGLELQRPDVQIDIATALARAVDRQLPAAE